MNKCSSEIIKEILDGDSKISITLAPNTITFKKITKDKVITQAYFYLQLNTYVLTFEEFLAVTLLIEYEKFKELVDEQEG